MRSIKRIGVQGLVVGVNKSPKVYSPPPYKSPPLHQSSLQHHTMSSRVLRTRSQDVSYAPEPPETPPPPAVPSQSKSQVPKSKKSLITKSHSASQSLQSMLPTSAIFNPLRHTKAMRDAANVLPRNVAQADFIEPSTIVNLFFTDSLMQEMTTNTNLYATGKGAGVDGREWKPVVVAEIKCWIGILIYMGVTRMPAIEDYWKHDGLYPTHHIRDFMSCTRFQQIRRYFHVAHPDAPKETAEGRRLWHSKVDPILDQLKSASQAYRKPSSRISIDEAMIRCAGRSKDTYKMPNKPIDQGFKFHCLANAGFIHDFIPTSNQCGPDPIAASGFPEVDDVMSMTSRLVFGLVQRNCHYSGCDQAFDVFLDNFYVNLPLFSALRKRLGIGACGTARTNSKDFPSELAVPKNAKLDYHFKTAVVKDGVAVILWMDNGFVCVMTTIHFVKGRKSEVDALRKKPGPKSTNAAGIKRSGETVWKVGEWAAITKIPTAIMDYNFHMNGVDRADQLRSYYEVHLKSWRTWYSIFFWAVDTILGNSFIIYNDHPKAEEGLEHKDFRMRLAWEYILGWTGSDGQRVSAPSQKRKTMEEAGLAAPKRQRYITKNTSVPPYRGIGEHVPVYIEGRQECVHCKWIGRKGRSGGSVKVGRTRWKCVTCNHPLCLSPERNCFVTFHYSDPE